MSTATRPASARPGGRSARVRDAVHRAVTELICERGADRVTIPLVASRAGVNPTTVYRRWGTVPALLAEVAAKELDADAPPAPTGDLRADLAAYAEWDLAHLSRPGGIAFFRAEVAADLDERKAGLRECLRQVTGDLEAILAAARENGETGLPSVEQITDRVVAPLYFRVVFSIPGTDARFARGLAEEFLDGRS
ncbi:TetR/AcrR family transcriptional regulator [Actinomadura opuntiae]|uniref:TetR/AcrR family transcriptional regulator n=1 Tax=Actinomadura sp. OS1-43 TaxID=604315 RepID=UPI00255A83CC|nr:TetR/AcrR family transcriptional regulator [Actinomadura sp. OS1-43]MDL4817879.1 TetR/AcrR family transcriptional regulator [Actinomadura sp. OS1-43]